MESKLEKGIFAVLEYIVAIFMVLECRSVYLYSIGREFYIMQILGISMIVLFLANLVSKKIKWQNITLNYKFILGLTVYNFIFVIVHKMMGNELVRFLYIFEAMFLMLYIYYKSDCENITRLLKKIVNVIIIISLISLFFYTFGSILDLIPTTGNFKITWGDFGNKEYVIDSYLDVHFNIQKIDVLGMNVYRNTGIFTEGPMFALNLVIALAVQLFVIKEKKWLKILIIVITIFTTLSTAGILGCILCGVLYLLGNQKIKELIKKTMNRKKKILICTLIVALVAVTTIGLLSKKMQTASYSTRIDDYIASILAWKDHIIFGNGIFNEQAIIQYMSETRSVNTGISNSIATTLANGGVYLATIYLYSFGAMIKNYKKSKDINMLFFFIVMIFLSITTVFQYTITMINIMAFSLAIYNKRSQ